MVTVFERFGARIRLVREKKNISQLELADKALLDITTISDIENGKRNPTLKTISKIAESLGVNVKELMEV